jgi:hypothetical protein
MNLLKELILLNEAKASTPEFNAAVDKLFDLLDKAGKTKLTGPLEGNLISKSQVNDWLKGKSDYRLRNAGNMLVKLGFNEKTANKAITSLVKLGATDSEATMIVSALNESTAHATVEQVEHFTPEQVLDKADMLADGDDLTPIHNGKGLTIDEVTTDDDGNPVVVLEVFVRRKRWLAHVTFGPDLEAIRVNVEEDSNAFRR